MLFYQDYVRYFDRTKATKDENPIRPQLFQNEDNNMTLSADTW